MKSPPLDTRQLLTSGLASEKLLSSEPQKGYKQEQWSWLIARGSSEAAPAAITQS